MSDPCSIRKLAITQTWQGNALVLRTNRGSRSAGGTQPGGYTPKVCPVARTLGSSSPLAQAPLIGVQTLMRGGVRRVVMGFPCIRDQRNLEQRWVSSICADTPFRNGYNFWWLVAFRPLLPLTRDKGPNAARGSNKRIFRGRRRV